MSKAAQPSPRRDPTRTREAILDAAEQLFAEQGYESASLAAIGQRAGVSRGTPGYFFETKQALYRATIARVLVAEAELLLAAHERATAVGGGPEEVVAALVEAFLDFLVARPTFIWLIEREATAGGVVLQEVAAQSPDVQVGLATLSGYFVTPAFRAAEPTHVLLSLLALCWFPLAHADTFTRALGLEPDAPNFLPAWKRHVVALVLRGLHSSP